MHVIPITIFAEENSYSNKYENYGLLTLHEIYSNTSVIGHFSCCRASFSEKTGNSLLVNYITKEKFQILLFSKRRQSLTETKNEYFIFCRPDNMVFFMSIPERNHSKKNN